MTSGESSFLDAVAADAGEAAVGGVRSRIPSAFTAPWPSG
jgi:hypothetical protein